MNMVDIKEIDEAFKFFEKVKEVTGVDIVHTPIECYKHEIFEEDRVLYPGLHVWFDGHKDEEFHFRTMHEYREFENNLELIFRLQIYDIWPYRKESK